MKTILAGLLTSLIILTSCLRESVVFREYVEMNNMIWNRFNIIEFEVPVHENDVFDFKLFLRHHTDFPYDKLFVNITFYSPGGDIRSKDYTFDLKDYRGDWLANGMGELWDLEILIRKEMPFYENGICKVRIENKYPKFDTPDIIEVGLIVQKSEK
jgi:gliding motility-associated lipoprotein GldH